MANVTFPYPTYVVRALIHLGIPPDEDGYWKASCIHADQIFITILDGWTGGEVERIHVYVCNPDGSSLRHLMTYPR